MNGRSRRKSRISAKSDFKSCRREISRRMGTSTQRTPSRAEIFLSVSSPEATPTTSKRSFRKRSCPRSRPSSELATVVSRISFGRRPPLGEALCSGKFTRAKHSELPIRWASRRNPFREAVPARIGFAAHSRFPSKRVPIRTLSATAENARTKESSWCETARSRFEICLAQRIGNSLCFLENHVDF